MATSPSEPPALGQAAGPVEEFLVSVASDLAPDGEIGRSWLTVERLAGGAAEVRVRTSGGQWGPQGPEHSGEAGVDSGHLLLAAPPPPEAVVVLRLPLSQVQGCRFVPLVGAGAIVADTPGGPASLVRLSAGLAADFGLAARAITSLAKGEPLEIDPRDIPRYCPRCGRRLAANTRVCPSCVDRGAVVRRILEYARPYGRATALAAALVVASSFFEVLPPKFSQWITDGLLYHNWPFRTVLGSGMPGLVVMVVLLLAAQAFGLGLTVWRGRIGNWVSSKVIGDIRTGLWRGLQRLSLTYFDRAQVGEITNRVNADAGRMQEFLTDGAQYFIGQVVLLAFVVVMMFATNWRLALVAVLPGPLMLGVSYVCWPIIRRSDRRLWQMIARLNVVVNDAVSGMRVVKAFGQEAREIERFDAVSDRLVDQNVATNNVWVTVFPIFGFVSGLGGVVVWIVGGAMVLRHTLEFGTIVAFTGYIAMLLGPLQWMSNLINWMTRATTSAERVFEVMDTEPDVTEPQEPEDVGRIRGHVRLENVQFGYAPHIPVIKGITLEVQPGEMIGLVGHSGAGKSTLINLLCRLYDPDQGRITVDGHDLRRLRMEDLHSQFGIVLQDTFLFDGTVAENIAYARPGAPRAEIMRAARIANAHEFIVAMPDGYDTRVGERGARLSGGERQRVAIARAVLHDPRILILDEATASVDTQTERKIQEAIARLVRGRTTFAIAHRLSTLRNANRLVVLDKGRVVEVGTHDELLAVNGRYAALVHAQEEASQIGMALGDGAAAAS